MQILRHLIFLRQCILTSYNPIVTESADITIAAKCAPQESILDAIIETGLTAVELYTNNSWLYKTDQIVKTCEKYPLKYSIHAPSKGYEPDLLFDLARQIKAEVIVFHNIYWDNEWEYIIARFKSLQCKLCIENTFGAVEPIKYIRRFGLGRCLDLEHLMLEVNGIFEEPFFDLIKESSHIHMTGYTFGSNLWHTPVHHTPEQSIHFLNLLKKARYSGFVVSEAKESYQTKEEFKALYAFFENWKDRDY